jgi:single-stranded-DNA-specific exonuclease
MRLPKRWEVRAQSPEAARSLVETGRYTPPMARTLAARGWLPGPDLETFMMPKLSETRDPMSLIGMEATVARISEALSRGERIAVYGDYDADGISATAIMARTLQFLGHDPVTFIPHRLNDGYGLSSGSMAELARQGVRLIITVDTGISAVAEVDHARSLGMDVVITDHHLPGESLPAAVAIVNPNLADRWYEGGRLCGAGVAFKVSHALVRTLRPESAEARAHLRSLLDLVALATVADVVPLLGENRTFVRHGLESLANSSFAGIRALMKYSSQRGGTTMTPEVVGFGLAPRLNAAGRTDGNASLALRLLMTNDEGEAAGIAERLDAMNVQRRTIESQILTECLAQLDAIANVGDACAFVLASEGWHLGVVGTVASRICERYHRPAVILGIDGDVAKGSARSIPGYDVHNGLNSCQGHLLTWGGHRAAAGVRLERGKLDPFREALEAHAREMISAEGLLPSIEVDTEVEGNEIDWKLWEGVQAMQPYGEGNRPPVFLLRETTPAGPPRVVGTGHLKLTLRVAGRVMSGIGFSLGEQLESWRSGRPHDVLFRPIENTWMGTRSLELEVLDSRASA